MITFILTLGFMQNRKELKEQYKNRKPPMGVYQIRNKKNGRVFIDSSPDIPAKWNRIMTELKFGSHRNPKLQEDWKKFEVEDFEFSVLSELKMEADETLDVNKELKLLKEMILEEMKEQNPDFY
jgi:hypothetical protein